MFSFSSLSFHKYSHKEVHPSYFCVLCCSPSVCVHVAVRPLCMLGKALCHVPKTGSVQEKKLNFSELTNGEKLEEKENPLLEGE